MSLQPLVLAHGDSGSRVWAEAWKTACLTCAANDSDGGDPKTPPGGTDTAGSCVTLSKMLTFSGPVYSFQNGESNSVLAGNDYGIFCEQDKAPSSEL